MWKLFKKDTKPRWRIHLGDFTDAFELDTPCRLYIDDWNSAEKMMQEDKRGNRYSLEYEGKISEIPIIWTNAYLNHFETEIIDGVLEIYVREREKEYPWSGN